MDANGEPIIGASVVIKGTGQGTITDLDGNFSINCKPGDILVISYVGYESQEVKAGSDLSNLVLKEDASLLDEVVVIGYGVQKKSDLTGAVSNISAEKLSTQSNPTVGAALQGKIAGVDIVSQGGQPGSGLRVMVRGIGTINNSTPLYIVDGMYMSSIDNINPNDVKSIDVLKDASASAIYGSRAANGVVIITTKSGVDVDGGEPEVNFSANVGFNTLGKKLSLLNAAEWADITTRSRAADGLGPEDMALDLENKEDNDWQDLMFRTALFHNYNLSVSGGSKYVNYYTSLGYTYQDGTIKSTDYSRYNGQAKIDFHKGRFSAGTNVLFSYDNTGEVMGDIRGGFVGRVVKAIPTMSQYDPDAPSGYGMQYGDVVNMHHPLVITDRDLFDIRSYNTKIFTNVYLQFEFLKGLKYKLNLSPDFHFRNWSGYEGVYNTGLTSHSPSTLENSSSRTVNVLLENLLTYDREFGDHKISLLAGYTYSNSEYHYLSGKGSALAEGIYELGSSAEGRSSDGNSSESTLISLLGRAFYSYQNKYLVTATIRRDGSSKFPRKNHWGNFPSFSLGWNLGEESFIKDNATWLNQLKIRGGYGVLGNQEVGNYQYTATVTSGLNYANGEGGVYSGAFPKYFPNPNIKWETTQMTNLGLDFVAFNNRLQFTADWYRKNTKDILLNVPVAISSGAANDPIQNVGTIRNTGFEFSIGWQDTIGRDFGYGVNFICTTNSNKVTAMGTEDQSIPRGSVHGGTWTTKTLAGYPIGGFWLIPTDGYFASDEEAAAYTKDGVRIQPSAVAGDIRFKDVNGDGTINDDDRVYSGSPFPDFTYSINANVFYKNFDLSFSLQGVAGNKIYNATRQELENTAIGTNYSTAVLDYWRPDNLNASVPRLTWKDPNNNNRTDSDRYLESGSYLRLRNFQLGYTIPNAIFKGYVKKARVYFNAENLFTITNYSGYTPDVNSGDVHARGFDEFIYPSYRTFMFGINVTF